MSETFTPEANPNAPDSVILTDLVDTFNTATGRKFPTRWSNIKHLLGAGVSSVEGTPDRITVAPNVGAVIVNIAATYVGQTSIITLGTVTTGTLSTGAIIAGVTMTLGGDASYDTYYRNAGGVLTRLANGTTGQVLTATTGAAPSWTTDTDTSGTVTSVSVVTNQGVSGSVANPTTTPAITLSLGALTGVTSLNGLIVTANTGVITTGTWNATVISPVYGGTGIANNIASTLTISGNFATTITVSAVTGVTLPTSGTIFSDKAGSITSAQFLSACSDETGTGLLTFATSPTFTTSIITPLVTGVSGQLGFSNTATATGSLINYTFTNANYTNQTLSVNTPDFKVIGSTKQWATGALATQYWNYFTTSTPTFVGASTLAESVGMYVEAATTGGANAIITNNFIYGGIAGTGTFRVGNLTSSTTIMAMYCNVTTPSTTNYFTKVDASNESTFNSATSLTLSVANSAKLTMSGVLSTGTINSVVFAIPVCTGMTANTNIPSFKITGASKQKATGADALQYFIHFTTNTLTYVAASVCTLAASMAVEYITGGTNSTITTSAAIYVPTKVLANTTNGIGILIEPPTSGTTSNIGLQISAGTATSTQIRLIAGTKLTTALAGVIENNGNFYLSNATVRFSSGGVLPFDNFADVTVGGAETDIYSATLLANTFNANGDKVTAQYGGNFVTVGTQLTQLKVYFAGTAIWDSTALAPATGTTSWRVFVELIRVSSSIVRYSVSLNTTGATGYVYCTVGALTGLTLSNTNILKTTGTSSGVGSGSGDILGKMGFVNFLPSS